MQELLAPREVQFYDCDWCYIGHKSKIPFSEPRADFVDLSQTLSNITGIGLDTLSDGVVERASIARRMSWAAQRQTSRREDSAYCLLGLFNISMPLLYGEGDKAFIRLQEEIIRTSDDHSIFAWRNHKIEDPRTRYSGMLAPSVDAFVGAGYIVQTSVQRERRPYSMTNMGLCIQLPLRNAESSRNRVICVLNCRYELGPDTQRLAVYLAEPWTMDSDAFMASRRTGSLLVGTSEVHGIARDNAMPSPVQTVSITEEERKVSTHILYIGAFPRYDPAHFVDIAGSLYIRSIPRGVTVTSAYKDLPRGEPQIWPLQLPHRLGVFFLSSPAQPRKLLVLILRSVTTTELPAAACILELSAESFKPTWPMGQVPQNSIMSLFYRCLRHGKDYDTRKYVVCNMARRSFGDVLVVDVSDALGGCELPQDKAVPFMLPQHLPPGRGFEALKEDNAKLSMPVNLCLKVLFRAQAEIDALLKG